MPKKKPYTVKLEPRMRRAVGAKARREGLTFAEVVRRLLSAYLLHRP